MDDASPPPPYSPRDPHGSQYLTAFNAFTNGAPTPVPGLPVRPPSGQTSVSATYNIAPIPVYGAPVSIAAVNQRTRRIPDEALERAGFVSAAPYFELRTPSQATPQDTFYHHMAIGPDARPENLPFPQPSENGISRSVDIQDWLTFLNHLFPPPTSEKG